LSRDSAIEADLVQQWETVGLEINAVSVCFIPGRRDLVICKLDTV
jgi:hypothetical protein